MLVDPSLAALRSDDVPQRCDDRALAAALRSWRQSGGAERLDPELARLAEGADPRELPLLGQLFGPDPGPAASLFKRLTGSLCQALVAAPLGQVPLRHFSDDTVSMLMLARRGNVTLALQAIDGRGAARRPLPCSAGFAPGRSWERMLAGAADANRIRLVRLRPGGAELAVDPVRLKAGDCDQRDGAREIVQLRSVSGLLVSLKLQHRDSCGEPMREYALADGALLHQAANCSQDSRLELALTLLGRMGRADAVPLLAAMAEEHGNSSLRWQALRECLGLDTARGFAALGTIARRAADPLSGPAGALRAQLLESYPALAALETGDHACLA